MCPNGGNATAVYTPNGSHRAAVQLGIDRKAKEVAKEIKVALENSGEDISSERMEELKQIAKSFRSLMRNAQVRRAIEEKEYCRQEATDY